VVVAVPPEASATQVATQEEEEDPEAAPSCPHGMVRVSDDSDGRPGGRCVEKGVETAGSKKDAAKQAYKEGKEKIDHGDYSGAMSFFEKADKLVPGAAPKYYIAFCLDGMKKTTAAIQLYKSFLLANTQCSAQYCKDLEDKARQRLDELGATSSP
jgi:hypothetical protein